MTKREKSLPKVEELLLCVRISQLLHALREEPQKDLVQIIATETIHLKEHGAWDKAHWLSTCLHGHSLGF